MCAIRWWMVEEVHVHSDRARVSAPLKFLIVFRSVKSVKSIEDIELIHSLTISEHSEANVKFILGYYFYY